MLQSYLGGLENWVVLDFVAHLVQKIDVRVDPGVEGCKRALEGIGRRHHEHGRLTAISWKLGHSTLQILLNSAQLHLRSESGSVSKERTRKRWYLALVHGSAHAFKQAALLLLHVVKLSVELLVFLEVRQIRARVGGHLHQLDQLGVKSGNRGAVRGDQSAQNCKKCAALQQHTHATTVPWDNAVAADGNLAPLVRLTILSRPARMSFTMEVLIGCAPMGR